MVNVAKLMLQGFWQFFKCCKTHVAKISKIFATFNFQMLQKKKPMPPPQPQHLSSPPRPPSTLPPLQPQPKPPLPPPSPSPSLEKNPSLHKDADYP